jgi:hypothetical protein
MLLKDKLLDNNVEMIGHYNIKQTVEKDFRRLGITHSGFTRFK